MENKKTFGAYLCRRRKELGLTQREFAEKLYVTESAVSKWERGLSYPDVTILRSICAVLEISEHELLTASEDVEARRVEQLAGKYLRLMRNVRWGQYIFYGLIALCCLIGNLASRHTLSWFWIVLSSELLSASLTLTPVLVERKKGLWTMGTFTAALELLLLVCCLYTGGDWFIVALMGTLLALSTVFLPFVLREIELPPALSERKTSLYLLIETALLLLLLAACAWHSQGGWFAMAAMGSVFGLSLFFTPVVLYQAPLPEVLQSCKLSLYLGIETVLLLLLLGVGCLWSGGDWFAVAALGTLLGLTIVLLPICLRQLPLPEPYRRHKALLYLTAESALLLLLLAACSLHSGGGYFLRPALPLALFGLALPWGLLGILRYLPVGRWYRAALALFFAAGYWSISIGVIDRIVSWSGGIIMDGIHGFGFAFDFGDWSDVQIVGENVGAIIALSLAGLGALCLLGSILWRRRGFISRGE